MYLNIIKAIYDKSTANIILNGDKAESFSSKIRSKISVPTFAAFIKQSIASPSHSNYTRKIKGNQIGKEEIKPSLFADDMMLYIGNPNDSTKTLLE